MTVRVALLVDSLSFQEWEWRALEHLLADTELDATVSLLVVNERDSSSSIGHQLRRFFTDFSLWNFAIAGRKLRRAVGQTPWYRKRVPLERVLNLAEVTVVSCRPEPAGGLGNILPPDVVSELESVDVAVRFGFGILRGDALSAPTHGVLSYHHGDLREYRGRPAGFYEFINGEETAGVTIQRLSDELDAGEIAASTHFEISDASSWSAVQHRLFAASPPLLATAVRRCVDDSEEIDNPATLGQMYTTPNAIQLVTYIKHRLLAFFG